MSTKSPLLLILASVLLTLGSARADQGSGLPDYVGQSGSAETDELRAGFPFASSFTFTNAGDDGSTTAGPVKLRYQLARFPADPFPITLGWQGFVNGMPQFSDFASSGGARLAGSSRTTDQFLTVPEDTDPGTYQLRVRIDPDNTHAECDEGNNFFVIDPAAVLLPTPDLDFRITPKININGDDVLDAGESFSVTAWIKNAGDLVDIPPFAVDFYLLDPDGPINRFRSNAPFDPADYRLLGRAVSAAFPAIDQTPFSPNDGHLLVTGTFELPADLNLLHYKIGVFLDPDDAIPEQANELNRDYSFDTEEITVIYVRDRPDYAYAGLASTSVSPTTFSSGDVVEFSGRIENLTSFSTTAATTVRHYLTRVGYDSETHLGISLIPPIEQGVPFDFTVPFQIPGGISTSEHTYHFEIDSVDVIPEIDETNNIGYGDFAALTITSPTNPDIVADPDQGMFTPAHAKAGETLDLSVTLSNQGYSATNPFHTRFVISRNATLRDADDITLATILITTFPAGVSSTLTPTVALPGPASLPPGTYHIGWIADVNHVVQEIYETNNTAIATTLLTIDPPDPILYPDLTPKSIDFTDKKYTPTETLQLKVFVGNIGKAEAKSSDLSVFLSSDFVAGGADDIALITHRISAPIASSTTEQVDISIKLPPAASLATGPYYLVVVADSTGVLDESSETNNDVLFVSRPIIIRQKLDIDLPALSIASVDASPQALLPGARLSPLVVVENDSPNHAVGVTTELVLSSDGVIGNADDLLLANYGPEPFAPFFEQLYSDDITLPQDLAPGVYTLAWTIDPEGLVTEIKPQDNTATMQITVREPLLQMIIINPDPDPEELVLALEDTQYGFSYRIQFSLDLTPGSWQDAGPIVAGDPNTIIFFGVGAPLGHVPIAPRIYFRAVLIPTG